jgi:hypothetical protein
MRLRNRSLTWNHWGLVACYAYAFALVPGGIAARAGVIMAPAALAGSEGNSLYNFTSAGAYTYQQLYGTSQLTGLTPGDVISGLQFRLNGGDPTGPAAGVNLSNFDVYLGPSNFAVGSLSSSTAGNEGPGTVLARSGAISFAAGSYPGGGTGPDPFGPVIPFTTPFTYTGGSLLLTLSYSTPTGGPLSFDAGSPLNDVQARSGAGYNNATVSANFSGTGLVAQFVPEPAGALLVIAGMLAHAMARRR